MRAPTLGKPIQPFDDTDFLRRLNRLDPADERLRQWIDEWIATGRSLEGVENPQSRSLDRATSLSLAIFHFSQNHMLLIPSGTTLVPHFAETPGKTIGPGYPLEMVTKAALFMMSPLRLHIARCTSVGCGKYFVLRRARCLYKRGTHCDICQKIERKKFSGAIISDQRRAASQALYTAVFRKFRVKIEANPTGWNRDTKLRAQIIAHLNQHLGKSTVVRTVYKRPLTSKWLNGKNCAGIIHTFDDQPA